MEISHQGIAPGKEVVTLTGKLMLGPDGDRIISLVEELLAKGQRIIIFDLTAVAAIDSTGIGRFISSFNKIMAVDGEMRMAGAAGHVLQSFQVSLLDKVFRFFPTLEAAK